MNVVVVINNILKHVLFFGKNNNIYIDQYEDKVYCDTLWL